ITVAAESGFADRLHDLLDTLLYQSIPYTRDSQGSGTPVWFWDFFTPYASWGIAVFTSLNDFAYHSCNFIGSQFSDICNFQLVRSWCKTSSIGFSVPLRQQDVFSRKDRIHQHTNVCCC